jgi:hypothetical protein
MGLVAATAARPRTETAVAKKATQVLGRIVDARGVSVGWVVRGGERQGVIGLSEWGARSDTQRGVRGHGQVCSCHV